MENELLNILKDYAGAPRSMLYNALIILDSESRFNEDELNRFIAGFTLLSKDEMTEEEYRKMMSNIDKVSPDKFDKLKQDFKRMNSDWIGVSGKRANQKKNILKIYLSVDNCDLHYFANLLILQLLKEKCEDYDFKINYNQDINRRDNIVIYCNNENFGKYVAIVQDIIKKNSDIRWNSPNLLGIPYDEHIYCGIDSDDGEKSYTEMLCNDISLAVQQEKSVEDIVDNMKLKQLRMSEELHTLAAQTVGNEFGKRK